MVVLRLGQQRSSVRGRGFGNGWTATVALAARKRATGRALGNGVLETGARVTVIDGLLASAVLVGLLLNATAALWWADPAAALGVRESRRPLRPAGR